MAGPFDQWPIGMGFEYFYGFMGGETDQWTPYLFRDHTQIFPWVGKPGYNLTTDMADEAIKLHERSSTPRRPTSRSSSTTCPAAATRRTSRRRSGSTSSRASSTWAGTPARADLRQPEEARRDSRECASSLRGRTDLPKWDTLSADEKKLFARQAEVFAAYTAYTDHEIGRVIQAVEDMGKLDNTLIIYIGGDNGTSPEGTLSARPTSRPPTTASWTFPIAEQLKFYDVWGSAATYPHMAVAWSWAFDTPFKWTKQVASHFGGTRQGMAISWPGHIKDAGGIRTQFHHVIDIVPTILEATGIQAPEMVDGIKQKPIEGVSMAYTFDKANANAPSTRTTQYFEMIGNRGIYHDGWYANTTPPHRPVDVERAHAARINDYKWELYNLTEDYSQSNDLAAKMPDKLKEMQAAVRAGGSEVQRLPLDNSIRSRGRSRRGRAPPPDRPSSPTRV